MKQKWSLDKIGFFKGYAAIYAIWLTIVHAFYARVPSLTLSYLATLVAGALPLLMWFLILWAIASGFNRATMPKVFSWKGRVTRLKWLCVIPINLLIVFGTAAFGQLDFSLGIVGVVWMFTIGAWITVVSTTKRLHDINRRGWWQLVGLVPVFGQLAVIIVCGFVKGTIGPNRFGDDPKELL